MIENISDKDFNDKILKNKGIILVDFWATWCIPCKNIGIILEEIEKEINNIKIYKIDVDKNNIIRDKYEIMSVPTIIFFKNGKIIDTIMGFLTKKQIINRIEAIR